MRRIKLIISLLTLQIIAFSPISFSAESIKNGAAVAGDNTSIITSTFTTELLVNLVFAFLVIIFTFLASKITRTKLISYLESSLTAGGESREELVGMISRTVNVVILAMGFSITLSILGFDMGIFMGGIGFGIGFTLKTFLTNFISGIMMITQGTYHNGDIIQINEKVGKITKIDALFTTVEQFDGVIFYVPNVQFSEDIVMNYRANDKRRVEVEVGVDYDTDITKAKKVCEKVLDNFPNILRAPGYMIIVDKLDDSSVNLKVRFWISSSDKYFEMKSNVTETIHLAFKQSGISIPFPQVVISNRK